MAFLSFILLLIFVFNFAVCLPFQSADPVKCDYSNCPKPDPNRINVHLVPHTHDDVGWLKTVDQYYYGSRSDIQRAGVQYILDSVVQELIADPNRRFIYVETAFFWKWWTKQTDEIKQIVRNLVNNGQLEFISGGWSMNDEATAHYNQIVDQMTWGFRRLHDEFGVCGIPKIGWQIDPFGHSREQANLFAQMNFDGLFFARLDHQDKDARAANKTLELLWKGSDDLGKASDLFTGAMAMGYGPPPNLCYDILCDDQPFIDDPSSEDYNVDRILDTVSAYSTSYQNIYATKNLLFPMGTDFLYQSAHPWFKNMDKLIKYSRERKNYPINIFYSSPSCYLYSIQQSGHTFTTKSDDFFPYGSDDHAYWTGYFTSRPAIKRYDKVGNNILQISKQLDVLALLKGEDNNIANLREAMGIMQHHDAVSGTEKQHVSNNYALLVSKGVDKCKLVINDSYKKLLLKPDSKETVPNQIFCDALNISACGITEGSGPVAATFYNPIARPVTQLARLPVTGNAYQVLDPNQKNVSAQLIPIPVEVLNIPGRDSRATTELVFEVNLPALGFATYLIKQISKSDEQAFIQTRVSQNFALKSKSFSVQFGANGAISGIQLANGKVVKIDQEFEYYKGMKGDNKKTETRASGAYIFRPEEQTPTRINPSRSLYAVLAENSHVSEVHQKWNPWISQVIRVFPSEDVIEFEWVVGPIPIEDKEGKEIITRFTSDLDTNATYYTDANGRQILQRIRDYRPTWKYNKTEPTSGNYYPVNSRIFVRDEKQGIQMTVLNDRSQGGASIVDGSVELMVHRRLLYDDSFGVDEALNETAYGVGLVVRGKHWMIVETIKDSAKRHRDLAQRIFMEPLVSFSNYKTEDDYYKNFVTNYSALVNPLPPNVHLLTLEEWINGSYLLRLEHFYETNEDSDLSKPVTVNLKNLFKPFTITGATEMTLGGNEVKGARERLQFKSVDPSPQKEDIKLDSQTLSVTLYPMQIKTFIITISPNSK